MLSNPSPLPATKDAASAVRSTVVASDPVLMVKVVVSMHVILAIEDTLQFAEPVSIRWAAGCREWRVPPPIDLWSIGSPKKVSGCAREPTVLFSERSPLWGESASKASWWGVPGCRPRQTNASCMS